MTDESIDVEPHTSERAMSPNKRRHPSNRKRPPKRPPDTQINNNVMDDVMAQLRRQREKQKLAAEDEAAAAPKVKPQTSQLPNQKPKSIGKFRYDPILKRYLPISTYKPNGNNDVCIQRMQQISREKRLSMNSELSRESSSESNATSGSLTEREIRRIVFRGNCLRYNVEHSKSSRDASDVNNVASTLDDAHDTRSKKRKKTRRRNKLHEYCNENTNNALCCSEKSVILLATALSYCHSTKRKQIVSKLIPLSFARRVELVPHAATKDMLIKNNSIGCIVTEEKNKTCVSKMGHQCVAEQKQDTVDATKTTANNQSTVMSTERDTWYSMLHPIYIFGLRQLYSGCFNSSIPLDCHCRSYLHPTASSFDVLSSNTHEFSTPHVVTVLDSSLLHYRAPVSCSGRGIDAFQVSSDGEQYDVHARESNPIAFELEEPAGGRIHGVRLAHLLNSEEVVFGCVTYASTGAERFTLHRISTPPAALTYEQFRGINDFCFGDPNLPPVAAFAHGTSEERTGPGVSFIDLITNRLSLQRTCWTTSDALGVQFRPKSENQQLLFGHRDGVLSMIDTRSTDTLFASLGTPDFGSVWSIQQLKYKEDLVIAKGSFGSCHVLDVRRLSNNKEESSQHVPSSVVKLFPPSDADDTKSAGCTGLAIDPCESTVLAPYRTHNQLMAALWEIDSGKLLRTIKLDDSSALYCELKSTPKCGFKISCANDVSTPVITGNKWGVWYKSRFEFDPVPVNVGGIQHMCFE